MKKSPHANAGSLLLTCSLPALCVFLIRASDISALAADEVRIDKIMRTSDAVAIQWLSDTNFYYNIWFSDSLTSFHPRFVPINLRGTGGVLSWTDSGDATSIPLRLSPNASSQRF